MLRQIAVWLTVWLGAGIPAEGCAAWQEAAPQRAGYMVNVELPLVGERDEQVRQQIRQIADAKEADETRPVVVLNFQSSPLATTTADPQATMNQTRGSQFERCLALARYLTSAETSKVRLIAFVPETVEGHAVLPVLACEEMIVSGRALLGRAAIDEPADATILGAYRDVVSRRGTLPHAIVSSMLDTSAEVYSAALQDGSSKIVSRQELTQLREQGQVIEEETIWSGGALAAYSGQQLRQRRWILGTATENSELANLLGLPSTLRTPRQLPRQWQAATVTISGSLPGSRVNQIVRAVKQLTDDGQLNLIVLRISPTECSFEQASRLAAFLSMQDSSELYSLSLLEGDLRGPIGLVAAACDEAVVIGVASLGPDENQTASIDGSIAVQRSLDELAQASRRPLPLLSAVIDPTIRVQEYINQQNGKRDIFTDKQMASRADAQQWLAKKTVAAGQQIDNEVALQYRLIDSVDANESIAFGRLEISEVPEELRTSWIDETIQSLLAQSWLPRLLLTVGFFALMAELGNPGISVGGLLAGLCFVGFFWIEGLNGNVEWLEVLLFIGGLIALALEIFVLPGFGLFGISGLLMLLVSVVLASQTFIWPTSSAQLSEVSMNLFWVALLALGGMIGLLFMHKQLERSPLLKWITLDADESDDLDIRESMSHREHLLGQDGIATTRLNPSGKAQFGSDIVAVVGTGKLIREGSPVRVVEVRGPLVIVQELA